MLRLKTLPLVECREDLGRLPEGKVLVNTINAHSYNIAQRDPEFAEALVGGDALIPDGASIVKACRRIGAVSTPKERVAGWDLFTFEMARLNERGGRCFFMGSSEKTLALVKERAAKKYPRIDVQTYSPPYREKFTPEEDAAIVAAINAAKPDLLWIGMTAPKQEKWTFAHWDELEISCHTGTIGAVFDFFAGTVKRAPLWWQRHGLEWLYRFLKEPRRMWRRYVLGNVLFLWHMAVYER